MYTVNSELKVISFLFSYLTFFYIFTPRKYSITRYTINKITEFIPKVSTKPVNTKNVHNKDSLNKLPLNKIENEFLEKTHFQVNVIVEKIQNTHLKKGKVEVDNFKIMKKIPEVKKEDIKNERENVNNVK